MCDYLAVSGDVTIFMVGFAFVTSLVCMGAVFNIAKGVCLTILYAFIIAYGAYIVSGVLGCDIGLLSMVTFGTVQ